MSISKIRRQIFDPLYSLVTGSPKVKYWKELEKTQFLPEDQLREKQWSRMKELLNYVFENNKFYRQRFEQAGIIPEDIQNADDIVRIPILKKDEIRKHTDSMITKGYHKDQLKEFKTGGSTGTSLKLYITEECSELRNGCARRHDRWSGWEVGEPIAAVWGNPKLPYSLKEKIKNFLISPMIYLDTININNESIKNFAEEWDRIRPTLIFGHAHSIFILGLYIKKLSIKNIRPKGIISSSMMLFQNERDLIEQVFKTKVIDRYGCEEVSLIASECEKHEGMHLNIDHNFIEFIKADGNYARPGEEGKIVVTDLINKAMPFIRYQVGDIGIPSSHKCSCERGFPLMENVTGRVADFLIKKDGSHVAGVSLIEKTLTLIPGIVQMQIIQESINRFLINIVKNSSFSDDNKVILLKQFKRVFGDDIEISLSFNEKILPEKSGKYRFSISKVRNGFY
jgi:phenylacetate-CoA ligase